MKNTLRNRLASCRGTNGEVTGGEGGSSWILLDRSNPTGSLEAEHYWIIKIKVEDFEERKHGMVQRARTTGLNMDIVKGV